MQTDTINKPINEIPDTQKGVILSMFELKEELKELRKDIKESREESRKANRTYFIAIIGIYLGGFMFLQSQINDLKDSLNSVKINMIELNHKIDIGFKDLKQIVANKK